MAVVALGAGDRQPQHLEHAGIALVEIEGDDLGIAIDAQGELRQIVGSDGEAVEQLGEGVDLDHIVGDLAHDIDLEPVLAAREAVLGHDGDDPARLLDPPAEGHHDAQILQSHDLAHPAQGGAFQGKARRIGGVRIARGAAEPEHRVLFLGLEVGAADQAGIFVGLEVR